jgi:hypothetical protein
MRELTADELQAYADYLASEKNIDENTSAELLNDAYNFVRLHIAEGGSSKPENIWSAFTKSPVYQEHFAV